MLQQNYYERIRSMDHKQLRNNLRPKRKINDYIEKFKKLNNSCLYIKEALQNYEKIPQVNKDISLLSNFKKLSNDAEIILQCIQNLSEFFIYY